MVSRLSVALAWRQLMIGKHLLTLPAILSMGGMALGVASLIMALGVFSGYQKTLETAIRDVTGDLVLLRSGGHLRADDKVMNQVKAAVPEILSASPFVQLEGMVAANGVVAGAMLQGVDVPTVDLVTNIKSRLREGEFRLRQPLSDEQPLAVIGQGMARRFKVGVGDQLKFVLPLASKSHALGFAPKVLAVEITGIVDLGKYEFDERFVITDLHAAQKLAGFAGMFSGYRFRLTKPEVAQQAQQALNQTLGYPYWTRSWQQMNQNLLQAAALEKVVMFLVVCLMILVASFNVAGHLYVAIIRKYSEISTLRTLGARSNFISSVFSAHGVLVGAVGTLGGVILGLIGVRVVQWMIGHYDLLPAEIYRISEWRVEVRPLEFILILVVSLVLCYLATLIPARRAGKLTIIEGIRHE
jgi:lipoprotein-releasing system permease protein